MAAHRFIRHSHFLSSPILFRKRTISLRLNDRTVAVAKRSVLPAWDDGVVNVYAGKEKIFSLWTSAFTSPLFFYPFADGQRFLCDYNDDTAILVFVVDFRTSVTNATAFSWPGDDFARKEMAARATNVVMETKGIVRLPTYAELQEVSTYLIDATPQQIKNASFPYCDLGILWNYAEKNFLLADVATNRQASWPLP
jgi:hypothetical protein